MELSLNGLYTNVEKGWYDFTVFVSTLRKFLAKEYK
jgi:hypothetical protein